MTSIDDLLQRDEHVVYATKASWIAPLLASRTGTLLLLGGLAALTAGANVVRAAGLLAIAFGARLLVHAYTERWLQDCFVTNRRVLTLQRRTRSTLVVSPERDAGEDEPDTVAWVWLEAIEDVGVHQELLGVWLDFGTVALIPANHAAEPFTLQRIRRPAELCRAIRDQLPPG